MELPSDMKQYIKHFGLHFNHKLYEFAVSTMERKVKGSDRVEKMKPVEKTSCGIAMAMWCSGSHRKPR